MPPYVSTTARPGAVPFLHIANRSVLAGARYSLRVLAGLSAVRIAGRLGNPAAWAIDGAASAIIAAIDRVPRARRPPRAHTAVPRRSQ